MLYLSNTIYRVPLLRNSLNYNQPPTLSSRAAPKKERDTTTPPPPAVLYPLTLQPVPGQSQRGCLVGSFPISLALISGATRTLYAPSEAGRVCRTTVSPNVAHRPHGRHSGLAVTLNRETLHPRKADACTNGCMARHCPRPLGIVAWRLLEAFDGGLIPRQGCSIFF